MNITKTKMMTDQEISEAVARKLGWKDLKISDGIPSLIGKKFYSEDWVMVPDYCHSIEAAWEIVDHLGTCGITIRKADPNTKWFCSIFDWKTGEPDVSDEADTAPLAICKAFLKLEDE